MDEAEVVVSIILKARQDAAIVLQPGKQAFNLLAAAIAPQGVPILGWRPLPITLVGGDEFDAFKSQPLIQRITVIGPIPNQAPGPMREKALEVGAVMVQGSPRSEHTKMRVVFQHW